MPRRTSGAPWSCVPLLGWIAGSFALGTVGWSACEAWMHEVSWAGDSRVAAASCLASAAIAAHLGALAWRRRRAALCLLLIGCACLGAARVAERGQRWDSMMRRWGLHESDRPRFVRARGVVVSVPVADEDSWRERLAAHAALHEDVLTPFATEAPRVRFDIAPLSVDPAPRDERAPDADIRVLVDGTSSGCLPGDTIEVVGWLMPLRASRNPGGFDALSWGRSRGIAGFLRVSSTALVMRVQDAPPTLRSLVARWRAWVDGTLRDAIGGDAPPDAAALVASSTTGGVWPGLRSASEPFRRTGTQHLVAISGFNFGILAAAILWGAGLMRVPRWGSATLLMLLALLFAASVQTEVSSIRAALMGSITAAAMARSRSLLPAASLALAALAIGWFDPLAPAQPGFQLSFVAVLGLQLLARPVARVLASQFHGLGPWHSTLRRLCAPLGAAIAAWISTLPIVLWHFGVCAWLCVPVTLVLTPPFAAMVVTANASIALTPISPTSASLFGRGAELSSRGVLALARASCELPGAITRQGVAQDRLSMDTASLRLDTLDVGDGSCHLVRTQTHTLLFDCGSIDGSRTGSQLVVPALTALGVERLDAVFVSHAHLDHFSALPEVVAAFPTRIVYCPPQFLVAARRTTSAAAIAVAAVRRCGVPLDALRAGAAIRLGDLECRVLHPQDASRFPDVNDSSLAIRVELLGKTLLFVGDASRQACADLLRDSASATLDSVEVMELPHHGSFIPQAVALVTRVRSGIVVQSTGPRRMERDRWGSVLSDTRRLVTSSMRACAVAWREDGTLHTGSWNGVNYDWTKHPWMCTARATASTRTTASPLRVGNDEESATQRDAVTDGAERPLIKFDLELPRLQRHAQLSAWRLFREWNLCDHSPPLSDDQCAVCPMRCRVGRRDISTEDGEPLGDFVDEPLRPPDGDCRGGEGGREVGAGWCWDFRSGQRWCSRSFHAWSAQSKWSEAAWMSLNGEHFLGKKRKRRAARRDIHWGENEGGTGSAFDAIAIDHRSVGGPDAHIAAGGRRVYKADRCDACEFHFLLLTAHIDGECAAEAFDKSFERVPVAKHNRVCRRARPRRNRCVKLHAGDAIHRNFKESEAGVLPTHNIAPIAFGKPNEPSREHLSVTQSQRGVRKLVKPTRVDHTAHGERAVQ